MTTRDLPSDLEFWAGRARHDGAANNPERPLPSFRRRGFRPPSFLRLPSFLRFPPMPLLPTLPSLRSPVGGGKRARPIAAAVLLAGLTGAWLIIGHQSHASPVALAPITTAQVAASSTDPSAPVTTTVPLDRRCRVFSAAKAITQCIIDGVVLQRQEFSPGTVAEAYHREAGADAAPHSGAPACAHGRPDERAWSTAAAPKAIAGRYRCRIENGRAALWWTHGNRLTRALANNGDLAQLFVWWESHPSE